ncbi:MAG TPA: HAMP domain-containing sensor histidine kinase [Candidatus Bathyarchaeia archaeon]|nr:HAMP domain-containing sensor histidine kinase [Candidatus Bathyarchaeia archaeon]
MRSLRLKFFLISWPLVVAAIAIVAFSVDRVTLVELERVEVAPRVVPGPARAAEWADEIGAAWPVTDDALNRLASSAEAPVDLVVLGAGGNRVATTDDGITASASPEGDGPTHLRRREVRGDGRIAEAEFALPGTEVHDAAGSTVGRLFVIPKPHDPPEMPAPEAWRHRLRRTLWIAAIAASVASAAAAFLLAGPLVRRVRRLSDASAEIGRGRLDARVPTRGEDELAKLGHSFNAMAAKLEQAETHKRNLVTDVAHELRTPLTNVIALIEAMQDGVRKPDASTLSSLRDEAGLLAVLVDDLQELSLAESGQLALQMESIDAVAAANAAVEAIAPSNGVIVDGPGSSPPVMARADARRLAQVLRNLLRNAITATPEGGRVTVGVTSNGDRVTITVADTGRGIPPEHLPLIWERFHRVDPSRARVSGGMGIGLALVRQLVRAMGGEVGVESEVGRGSRFRLELKVPDPISGPRRR